jgi:hypothetical protein
VVEAVLAEFELVAEVSLVVEVEASPVAVVVSDEVVSDEVVSEPVVPATVSFFT